MKYVLPCFVVIAGCAAPPPPAVAPSEGLQNVVVEIAGME